MKRKLTLPAVLVGSEFAAALGACYGDPVAPEELAVLSVAGGSSLTPDLIICAITG